jgi:hypothetical protein
MLQLYMTNHPQPDPASNAGFRQVVPFSHDLQTGDTAVTGCFQIALQCRVWEACTTYQLDCPFISVMRELFSTNNQDGLWLHEASTWQMPTLHAHSIVYLPGILV